MFLNELHQIFIINILLICIDEIGFVIRYYRVKVIINSHNQGVMLFYTPIVVGIFGEWYPKRGDCIQSLVNGIYGLVKLLKESFKFSLIYIKLIAALHRAQKLIIIHSAHASSRILAIKHKSF